MKSKIATTFCCSCLFGLNASGGLVVHSCLVQEILTSSLRVRMQGCLSHTWTSAREGQGQVRGQNIPEELTESHLMVLPIHHRDKYPKCQIDDITFSMCSIRLSFRKDNKDKR